MLKFKSLILTSTLLFCSVALGQAPILGLDNPNRIKDEYIVVIHTCSHSKQSYN